MTACASAPVNLMTESADAEALTADPLQRAHRQAAATLVETYDGKGWREANRAAAAAPSWMERLLSGESAQASGPETEDAEAVAAFIAAGQAADRGLADAFHADVERAATLTEAVAVTAADLAGVERAINPDTLATDIAAAERALGAARSGRRFFEQALNACAEDLSAQETEAITAAIDRLQTATRALSAAADALAQRRWAAARALTG